MIGEGLTKGTRCRQAPIFTYSTCLLYTSDAADERSSVDLGGRRIIKKKKQINEDIRIRLKNIDNS